MRNGRIEHRLVEQLNLTDSPVAAILPWFRLEHHGDIDRLAHPWLIRPRAGNPHHRLLDIDFRRNRQPPLPPGRVAAAGTVFLGQEGLQVGLPVFIEDDIHFQPADAKPAEITKRQQHAQETAIPFNTLDGDRLRRAVARLKADALDDDRPQPADLHPLHRHIGFSTLERRLDESGDRAGRREHPGNPDPGGDHKGSEQPSRQSHTGAAAAWCRRCRRCIGVWCGDVGSGKLSHRKLHTSRKPGTHAAPSRPACRHPCIVPDSDRSKKFGRVRA